MRYEKLLTKKNSPWWSVCRACNQCQMASTTPHPIYRVAHLINAIFEYDSTVVKRAGRGPEETPLTFDTQGRLPRLIITFFD